MNDAEYIFKTDSAEKKKIGHGATRKVRGGGKYVRLPSDNLTRKEKEALNGEVTSYDMTRPVKWGTFKRWPEDIQREYFKKLYHDFGFSQRMIGDVFGVSQSTVKLYQSQMNIPGREACKHVSADVKKRYKDFIWQKYQDAPKAAIEDAPVTAAVPAPVEDVKVETVEAKPTTLQADHNNIAAILAMLVGTGAKLTIEVTL